MVEANQTTNAKSAFFALLRSELCDNKDCLEISLSNDVLKELYVIANKHDLAHIIASALCNRGLLGDDEASLKFQKKQFEAIYRFEQFNYALNEIVSAFERSKIPYMPLKGAVLRALYPQPWMRTSCDIDILVHEEDLKHAIDVLVSELNYKTDNKRNYHDVSLCSPAGIHLELHFNIQENMDNIDRLLSKVWEHTEFNADQGFRYYQTNEFFVFHHIAHMSYHFVSGGCGIKPFVDLYILKKKIAYDDAVVRDYLKRCGLEEFYNNIVYLTNVWFGENTHTALSGQTEEYVLKGGVYGTLENKVAIAQNKKGGRTKYILSRIFLPYETLKFNYPVLKKHKWLFPFMQIRRWIGFFKKDKLKRGFLEAKLNNAVTKNNSEKMEEFLRSMGL